VWKLTHGVTQHYFLVHEHARAGSPGSTGSQAVQLYICARELPLLKGHEAEETVADGGKGVGTPHES
jgi:hypothetical protein